MSDELERPGPSCRVPAEAISRVPGWRVENVVVTPMPGGITNTNFRVDHDGVAFVLRVGDKRSTRLGIDRRRELEALSVVADLGVGATVVYADPDADILVTRFIRGRPVEATDLALPTVAARAARVIRRVHEGPAFPGVFSPFDTVVRYEEGARLRGRTVPAVDDALALTASLRRRLETEDLRPCHNDLLPANLIDDGERLWLIDWEYAAMGDPWFDLGNFAANASMSAPETDAFLAAYLERPPTEAERARAEAMSVVSDLREGFWGLAQWGASSLDFDFEGYAVRHLERALGRAEARGERG